MKRFALLWACLALSTVLACSDDSGGTSSGAGAAGASAGAGAGGASAGAGGSGAGAGGAAAGAGGAAAGSGGAACPSIGGTWTVKAHCQTALVGTTLALTQDGCTYKDEKFGFTGTIGADGAFTATGTPQGSPMLTCTGKASASEITQTCNPGGCAVTLTR